MQVTFFDIAQVPLAVMGGRVTGLGQHFGNRDLIFSESRELVRHADNTHAMAHRNSTGQECGTRRCTGRLRIHAREINALCSHLVEVRRFVAEILLQSRKTNRTISKCITGETLSFISE